MWIKCLAEGQKVLRAMMEILMTMVSKTYAVQFLRCNSLPHCILPVEGKENQKNRKIKENMEYLQRDYKLI